MGGVRVVPRVLDHRGADAARHRLVVDDGHRHHAPTGQAHLHRGRALMRQQVLGRRHATGRGAGTGGQAAAERARLLGAFRPHGQTAPSPDQPVPPLPDVAHLKPYPTYAGNGM